MKGREGTQTTRLRHNPKKGIVGCSYLWSHQSVPVPVPSHIDVRPLEVRCSTVACMYAPCNSNASTTNAIGLSWVSPGLLPVRIET